MVKKLAVRTARRTQLVEITRQVQNIVDQESLAQGVCHIFVPHTTAGILINEHADRDVASDMESYLVVC